LTRERSSSNSITKFRPGLHDGATGETMGLLEGKTAIITGGGTGVGLEIARCFHHEGARVVICGRRLEKLTEAASTISKDGDRVYILRADITKDEDVQGIVEKAVKETGRVDILVNNAAVLTFGKLEEVAPRFWDDLMNTNARAPWRLMIAVLPEMRKAGGGSIINVSSLSGIKAFAGNGIYGASKAALQELSQVLAIEVASENIRVNVICPGVVEDTELSLSIVGKENMQKRYDRMRPLHPLGRNGKPADIAQAALFLASDKSSWITGIILNVDGGRHLCTNRPPSYLGVAHTGGKGTDE
jgi:meso-butanediol dehydrogenase / (S,S)-butanediol dehydrogenase / diacetyl reductase